jgi:hypothetical protein
MTERRYTDEEVTEILRRATVPRPDAPGQLAPQDGMTLGQLEAIAREAGIEPERVAAAARDIDAPVAVTRRAVGVPVSVSRSVELSRRLTDAEWEFLVTRLRETFDATGKREAYGSLRQWSNGNLRVFLEPGIHGHRVRFTSMNAGMRFRLLGGISVAAGGIGAAFVASFFSGDVALATSTIGVISGVIGLAVVTGATRLTPRWRETRRTQFEALASELERLSARRMKNDG